MNKKTKRIVSSILANAVIIISAFIVFLIFADICEPEKLYINASETGNIVFPATVLTIAAAGVYISYRAEGRSDAARGGIALAILPHAVIILSALFVVLAVTNHFNHAMDFLTSDISKAVLLVYATLSILMAFALLDCASDGRRRR